jgi:4-alpha-glucanotransferase
MQGNGHNPIVLPFPPEYRASGILAHVTSLPCRHGIGDLGPAARQWVDRLHAAGQSWWQALPVGPTGYGDSPYQSLSSFAGNELLISPDDLVEDGLLHPGDCAGDAGDAARVDYAAVIPFKERLLGIAWHKFSSGARPDLRSTFEEFCDEQQHWLDDYAMFGALKSRFKGGAYFDWPEELVRREPTALDAARRDLAAPCQKTQFAQFLLSRQGGRLKQYARAKGVCLIGDLPFYVSPDSSDVWAAPQLFRLDDHRRPLLVAGVPPDYFSATGQLWGNPVYDWQALRRTGYRWWIERLHALLAHVDMVRLDHFRAFAAGWCVPAGSVTAETGSWVPGPGADFFTAAASALSGLPLIAEDLGLITPDVTALRERFGLPGMRVLQFAFDGRSDNPHLPDNYVHNTVVYTGTHDNPTTRGWFEALPERQRQQVWDYLRRRDGNSADAAPALIELAWRSPAALAMTPLQDLLNLGEEARMNQPGRTEGNWQWRCTAAMLRPAVWQWLHDLTVTANRARAMSTPRPDNGCFAPGVRASGP